jgi:hypothetical protein
LPNAKALAIFINHIFYLLKFLVFYSNRGGFGCHVSPFHSRGTPGLFYTCFYNHAHRLRLEKQLYIELSRSSDGFFKPLLDAGGGFTSETAARRFQK